MQVEIKFDCADVDWAAVSDTLKQVGMGYYEPGLHQKAFENSYVTVFLHDGGRMVGFGRAICDGAYQAAIYDVAVVPEFQKQGLGRTIMDAILDNLPPCNIILYATPGKEGFYKKHAFRKMKTGQARFQHAEKMKKNGFTE